VAPELILGTYHQEFFFLVGNKCCICECFEGEENLAGFSNMAKALLTTCQLLLKTLLLKLLVIVAASLNTQAERQFKSSVYHTLRSAIVTKINI